MLEWSRKQWSDIKGNVKYGLLVSVPFILAVITRGLAWWQQTILALLCLCVVAWAIVQTLKADRLAQSRQLGNHPECKPTALPDITVKDSDPKVYVEFSDNRGLTIGHDNESNLVLVNRGTANARIVAMETIYLKEHFVPFSRIGYTIKPTNKIDLPLDMKSSDGRHARLQDIFHLLFLEWESYKDAQKHELAIPLTATYQDDARNLFESRCELVFSPMEHLRVRTQGQAGGIAVVSTRNHQFRKLAIAVTAISA